MFLYTFYDTSRCFQNGALFLLLDVVFISAYARPPLPSYAILILIFRACLFYHLKLTVLHFKQHYTHFHPHVFQKTTNNITQTTLPNTPNSLDLDLV